jgi:SMC interacting uncharacterized protein involved in chromosome segregation
MAIEGKCGICGWIAWFVHTCQANKPIQSLRAQVEVLKTREAEQRLVDYPTASYHVYLLRRNCIRFCDLKKDLDNAESP